MSFRRLRTVIPVLVCQCLFLFASSSLAHPASGIVVDPQGHVYFVYTGHGVVRVDLGGKLTNIHEDSAGHWLALDSTGAFAQARLPEYERISPDGAIPTLIFASGGAPLVVGPDGNLYYGTSGSREQSFPTGVSSVARLSPSGEKELFALTLQVKLAELKDGITGLAAGPDGGIDVATWNGIVVLKQDGSIAKVIHPVMVPDCDSDPADHNPANASSPLLRGLASDSLGNIYVAATSCHRVLKIAPDNHVTSILRSERPWTPTGVAVRGEDIYVLEYTNGNGPRMEGWYPRVRKRTGDGAWITVVTVSPEKSSTLH